MNSVFNRSLAIAIVAIATASTFALAQDYPAKTITFIVPYAAGGSGDIRGRQIAQQLSGILGKPVIVDNKPGAGGNIGTEVIARAPPDGYVIGMGNFAPLSVNQSLFKKLNFDPARDLLPVVLIEKGPLALIANPKSPYKTVRDIVDAARAKPGVLTIANGGIGGSHHLSAELFKQAAGIDMISVAYKGGAPAATDVMAGNVDLMFEQMYAAVPSIQSGKLRPIAVTSARRIAAFPGVPTFGESGYPTVEVLNWQGVVVPRGTPRMVIDRLNAALNQALRNPDFRDKISSQNNEPGGGTPEDFAALIRGESAKWSGVVRQANIKPE